MFQQALMEYDIKRSTVKRTGPGIGSDEFYCAVLEELTDQAQTLGRVIQQAYISTEFLHPEAIAPGAGPDFQGSFTGEAGDMLQFGHYVSDRRVYYIRVLTRPEAIPDLAFFIGDCYSYPIPLGS